MEQGTRKSRVRDGYQGVSHAPSSFPLFPSVKSFRIRRPLGSALRHPVFSSLIRLFPQQIRLNPTKSDLKKYVFLSALHPATPKLTLNLTIPQPPISHPLPNFIPPNPTIKNSAPAGTSRRGRVIPPIVTLVTRHMSLVTTPHNHGFQRPIVARTASTSSGFKSTSGGRTGPPTSPIMSIIDFIADTS